MRSRWAPPAVLSLAVAVVAASGALILSAADVHAHYRAEAPAAANVLRTGPAIPMPQITPAPVPTPQAPKYTAEQLASDVDALAQDAGAEVGVSLVQLTPAGPAAWSVNGDQKFTAASTYKLPILMWEAQQIASGAASPSDLLCYQDSDYEDGWFDDYADGSCFTRQELAQRVGTYSDNTAAHILADEIGGTDAVNAYAAAHGVADPELMDPNAASSSDLAALWTDEAEGRAGGATAQAWLYPLLTNTQYEAGIPAGAPAGATVVHKVGFIDSVVNDAALVLNGPSGPYVLVVMTDGPGGDAGYSLIAQISSRVSTYEAAR